MRKFSLKTSGLVAIAQSYITYYVWGYYMPLFLHLFYSGVKKWFFWVFSDNFIVLVAIQQELANPRPWILLSMVFKHEKGCPLLLQVLDITMF